ncbi:GNAT family N-acetyltransferase [Paratissierella segnis]|jgi:hypothetical protein|uniref:GNAT family N-acetyltransferase n=1 Tax=Paratissierella segnis TaxID=2763679 RepID=A0A926IKB7_9FIRM|nr:GNAT family protein [Paratissierella segnis]MBC8588316.1 GNAT family N-acetyltransferase [Paratissierella segnis]
MISGDKVYLTAVEREDLPILRKWRNKEEFRKYFREYREISSEMQNNWFDSKVLNDPNTIMFSIRDIITDELLGCCGLCYINWVHRYADLSLYIGFEDSYIDENGIAEESCKLLFKYGFNELGLNKIWTEIYEFDIKKKKLYDTMNFKLDGVLRENYFYDGRWWNSFVLSLLEKDYLKIKSN